MGSCSFSLSWQSVGIETDQLRCQEPMKPLGTRTNLFSSFNTSKSCIRYSATRKAVPVSFNFCSPWYRVFIVFLIAGIPFLQVTGRNFILFAMIDYEPRMMTKPVVFYLFIIWGVIEVVRYPYYLTQLLKTEISILTWLRYTIWIPLYPLGVLCEGIIILRNIPYFEETKRLCVALPNKWNFAFHMPTFMYLYLIFLILPGIYFIMTHMQTIRAKKLGGRRTKVD